MNDTLCLRQHLEGFYQAFAHFNLEAFRQTVTADWRDIPPAPGQTPGPTGVAPVFAMLSSAFGEFRIEILDVLAQGDRVAVRAAMSGVHQGELFGIPPTGRTFTVALHEFHEFRDGRVAKTWHMEDWFSLFNQIGAFPSPGK